MSSFSTCQKTEQDSKRALVPVVIKRFNTSPSEIPENYRAQEGGDWFVRNDFGQVVSIELKSEHRYTGNIFLEIWSNFNTQRKGWFLTSHANEIWYHFLDTNMLYIVGLEKLRQWVLQGERILGSKEVDQKKHSQRNLTKGRLMPCRDLEECGAEVLLL